MRMSCARSVTSVSRTTRAKRSAACHHIQHELAAPQPDLGALSFQLGPGLFHASYHVGAHSGFLVHHAVNRGQADARLQGDGFEQMRV